MKKEFRIRRTDDFSDSETSPNTTLYCCCTCCIFMLTAVVGAVGGISHGVAAYRKGRDKNTGILFLYIVFYGGFWGALGLIVGMFLTSTVFSR